MVGQEFADLIRPDLTPAQACILAVAPCPGVTDVLLAASGAPQWKEAADAVAQPSLTAAKLRESARHPSSITLLVLTEPLYVAVGDQTDGESEECFVDVVASFPADAKASEAVEPGDRALDDVADDAQAGAVRLASLRDHGADPAGPEQAAVLVVVVAAVGRQCIGVSARSADPARDGRDLAEQGQKFIGSDPRPRLTFPRNQTNEQTSQHPHDQQLLLEPVGEQTWGIWWRCPTGHNVERVRWRPASNGWPQGLPNSSTLITRRAPEVTPECPYKRLPFSRSQPARRALNSCYRLDPCKRVGRWAGAVRIVRCIRPLSSARPGAGPWSVPSGRRAAAHCEQHARAGGDRRGGRSGDQTGVAAASGLGEPGPRNGRGSGRRRG